MTDWCRVWGFALAAACIGCSSGPASTMGCSTDGDCKGDRICVDGTCRDASVSDTGVDAAETGIDAAEETQIDAPVDSNVDAATVDASPDVKAEAAPGDALTDATGDAGVDAKMDADSGSDATADVLTDTGSTGGSPTCPMPSLTAVALKNEGSSPKTKLALTFHASGALSAVDGVACALVTGDAGPAWASCHDTYACGSCQDEILNAPLGDGGVSRTLNTKCPSDFGNYAICIPDCKGKTCGPDGCGGTCGPACTGGLSCIGGACTKSACQVCLDACGGGPGCCCGTGCVCESKCTPTCD